LKIKYLILLVKVPSKKAATRADIVTVILDCGIRRFGTNDNKIINVIMNEIK